MSVDQSRARGTKDVDKADRADPNHMGQANAGVGVLPLPGFAPQLTDHLDNLAGAGWSQGVAHGNEPS